MQYEICNNSLSCKFPFIARHLSLILLCIYLCLVPFLIIVENVVLPALDENSNEFIIKDIRVLINFTFGDWIAYSNEVIHEFDTLFRARCILLYSIIFLS